MSDGSIGGNGRFHAVPDEDVPDEDAADDDPPMSPAEEAAGALEALEATDETLDERVEAVIEDLDGVERTRDGESVRYSVGGSLFAVLMQDLLEVALDPAVAGAALKTGSVIPSSRGGGWIAFTPESIDRFALDRAEAWVRSAYRRVVAR
jgi:hypothetical protein